MPNSAIMVSNSVSMTSFAARVNADLDLELNPPDFFTYPTIAKLAGHILAAKPGIQAASEPPVAEAPLHEQPGAVEDGADPIVIAGMSCEFPGARGPEAFWTALREGRDCVTEIPADRWDWREHYGDPTMEENKTNVKWGGFIDGVDKFDPLFFGISPKEAELMDPQQRLLMTHVWKAIEDAGYAPAPGGERHGDLRRHATPAATATCRSGGGFRSKATPRPARFPRSGRTG